MSPISRVLSFVLVGAALLVVVGCDGLFYDLSQFGDELGCTQECVAPEHGTVACVDGLCEISCDERFSLCSGQCVDTENDGDHCGSCDESCGENQCIAGSCTDCDPTARPFGGGEGTSSAPYLLCSPDHLEEMLDGEALSRPLTGYFSLYGDIDMAGVILSASLAFGGVFDGGGHTIENLEIENHAGITGIFSELLRGAEIQDLNVDDLRLVSRSGEITGGLVGQTELDTLISNVEMSDIIVDTQDSAGAVVARNQGVIDGVSVRDFSIDLSEPDRQRDFGGIAAINHGTIRDARAVGVIGTATANDFDFTGGLVGFNDGVIEDTMADVDFGERAATSIGGLVGDNEGLIRRSYTVGSLQGRSAVGGLVGKNSGNIERCYSEADVDGFDTVGGVVGEMAIDGEVHNSYATGDVTAESYAGGFVGNMQPGTVIRKSYSTGTVGSGDAAATRGGFVGVVTGDAEIFYSHWDLDTSSMSHGAGVDSGLAGSVVEGIETAEFQSSGPNGPFVGWDVDEIWDFGTAPDGHQRPILRWQIDLEE